MAQRQRIDINMYQGDQRTYQFNVYTNAANTTPYDFATASEVKFSVRTSLDAAQELFTVSATNGQDGNNWTAGIAVFVVPANKTILLGKNGKYDVQITIGSVPVSPVYGDVLLQRQVAV